MQSAVIKGIGNVFTGAVEFDWRQAEFFGNLGVLDRQSFINLQGGRETYKNVHYVK